MANTTELAERLHVWAMKEMHFYAQGVKHKTPVPEDFAEYELYSWFFSPYNLQKHYLCKNLNIIFV